MQSKLVLPFAKTDGEGVSLRKKVSGKGKFDQDSNKKINVISYIYGFHGGATYRKRQVVLSGRFRSIYARKENKGYQMKHPVDIHVGKRVRQRRWMMGVTQQQLAEAVGIKFQQIQKYETGMNRISASRLWDIADALDVHVAFFFEGLEEDEIAKSDGHSVLGDLMADKEALELVRSYYAIPENQRRRLFELARVLSDVA